MYVDDNEVVVAVDSDKKWRNEMISVVFLSDYVHFW